MNDRLVSENLVVALNELVHQFQNSSSYTGDDVYDTGYESGRFSAGYELELLLRQYGLWS